MPVIISRNAGTPERRNAGTPERRNALLVTLALAAAALLLLLAVQPAAAQTVDYDANDNRLIEIDNLAQLNALRYDLNGNGLQDSVAANLWANYTAAFPGAPTDMGCPAAGCQGYELTRSLDFDTNGDGVVDGDDPGSYPNWDPIGQNGAAFRWEGHFEGNGHTIANLTITSSSVWHMGLFGFAYTSNIRRVGMVDVNINLSASGHRRVGGLVGEASSTPLRYVYSTGRISLAGATAHTIEAGGLAGFVVSSEVNGAWSSVTLTVSAGTTWAGGFTAHLHGTSTLRAVYATGAVDARCVTATCTVRGGGLFGGGQSGTASSATLAAGYATGRVISQQSDGDTGTIGGVFAPDANFGGTVSNKLYWNVQTSGVADADLTDDLVGLRTHELRRPTDYAGLYADWNVDVDGVTGGDDPWDFGGPRDYPLLKVDFNNDGAATWQEFGPQYRAGPPEPPPYNWRTDHPESYANARHNITASCQVRTTGAGDAAITTSTLTFDLADYTRPITLALSLWDKTHFRSLPSLGIAMPELRREGQTATVEVVTDPARTRFRLDGPYGLNLVLGYADCHTDDS